MSPSLEYQVVVLAGGDSKKLYPMTNGIVKALLPVANIPLLAYPLRTLSEAQVKSALVVVIGELVAETVTAWLQSAYRGPVHCEVVRVPDDCGSADALRHIAPRLSAPRVVVISGDMITDVPLAAIVLAHMVSSSMATVLVAPRRSSPAATTKPGQPPKDVDYLGLDGAQRRLLFYATSPEALRDLKLPVSMLERCGPARIHTDMRDAHLYVLDRSVFDLLSAKPAVSSLRLDLLPLLVRLQRRPPPLASGTAYNMDSKGGERGQLSGDAEGGAVEAEGGPALTPLLAESMSHTGPRGEAGGHVGGHVGVFLVPDGNYCGRVNSVQSYGDINREVAASDVALHLTGLTASRHDNVVPPGTVLGNKATVGPACVLGEGCVLGDKSSVKRSVLGANVRLGANVKVINSVLLGNTTLADGCHVQNSIVCAGAQVGERVTLKDCLVGPGHITPPGLEHKGETLPRA